MKTNQHDRKQNIGLTEKVLGLEPPSDISYSQSGTYNPYKMAMYMMVRIKPTNLIRQEKSS